MHRPDPEQAARDLVAELHPDAVQAWLGGSVHSGSATSSSDLDITVLHVTRDAYRRSRTWQGWPVELFVHTESSIRRFVEYDLGRRKPTMARLIADSTPLLPDSGGTAIRDYCQRVLEAGPPPMAAEERDLARYTLTDLLDDLVGYSEGGDHAVDAAPVIVSVWQQTAELILAANNHWTGSGKWLIRELGFLDRDQGTDHVAELDHGLRVALDGQPDVLIQLAERALQSVGGRLRDGYYRAAPITDH